MNWTKETPKVPGWYWFKNDKIERIVHMMIPDWGLVIPNRPDKDVLWAEDGGDGYDPHILELVDGEWFGPLECPK